MANKQGAPGLPKTRLDDEERFTKHLNIKVHPDDYEKTVQAAHRAGLTISEFGRRALRDAALALDRFWYVRLPNGEHHPSLSEVGYEFVENAQRFANRVNGKVIRASPTPTHLGVDAELDRERLDPRDAGHTS